MRVNTAASVKWHAVLLQGQSSMLRFKHRSSSEGESKFDTAFLKAWEKLLARSDLVLLPNCLLYQVKAERFSVQRQEHFTPEQSEKKKRKKKERDPCGCPVFPLLWKVC